jgi:hypothetical protein
LHGVIELGGEEFRAEQAAVKESENLEGEQA